MQIHLFEPSGAGGIFQHSLSVARTLKRSGHSVTIHTRRRHEEAPKLEDCLCPCVSAIGRGPRRVALAIAGIRYFVVTLPHLLSTARRSDILHYQGPSRLPLTLPTLMVARFRGMRVVHSPHNTFSRRGSALELLGLRLAIRVATTAVVFSEHDARRIEHWGGKPVIAPLTMLDEVEPHRVRRWRAQWDATSDEQVVLFAGQIRRDKRLDLLIESARRWPNDRRLAIVGEDKGDWSRCERLARQLGVELQSSVAFVDREDFIAAVAASDLVACPYDRASQSAVLALANQLGVPTISSDIGGLAELATASVPVGDPQRLTEVIDEVLQSSQREAPRGGREEELLHMHRRAYGMC